jgi:predicted RNase H-like HicB family nuclease
MTMEIYTVVTSGGTVEEALAMAREEIASHLEGLCEDGIEIPVEPPTRGRRTVPRADRRYRLKLSIPQCSAVRAAAEEPCRPSMRTQAV